MFFQFARVRASIKAIKMQVLRNTRRTSQDISYLRMLRNTSDAHANNLSQFIFPNNMNTLCQALTSRICEFSPTLGLAAKEFTSPKTLDIRDFLTVGGMTWALQNGYRPTGRTFCLLFEAGHLDVIQLIDWTRVFTRGITAAAGGHLDTLKWLHANGCASDVGADLGELYWVAAHNGHVHVLEWMMTTMRMIARPNSWYSICPPHVKTWILAFPFCFFCGGRGLLDVFPFGEAVCSDCAKNHEEQWPGDLNKLLKHYFYYYYFKFDRRKVWVGVTYVKGRTPN